ncbi:LPXTG cell wall anchor domain-containing protein [Micromonospora foliorum]|uniref:LPXTG cell wall anchor domain-containing protein n=1 Tax=Micromonospora foliorum TaxID=2911210 RepID=UPI001EE842B7|nr:LPXTG cell wall anchor domain-containing protein [Micromonospora foliorum]MCG5437375.1 LPXTG cell wall anchor domain-containing protein [Micromonospora foliorum]
MARTAANYLVGGALAATASLALAVSPVLAAADPASARGISAARAESSADTGVTFEIVPASPTPPPTQPPPTSTPTAPPQPPPSHGGELPVTGPGGSVLLLAVLGAALIVVGWFAAPRRRPS